MKHIFIIIFLLSITIAMLGTSFNVIAQDKSMPPTAERDTPQGEKHFAVARVIYPNRVDPDHPNGLRDLSIQAQLEPAPFTIPKGYVATTLNYRWVDPKTDRKNEKLTATTIYSVTEKRYLKEAKNNPDLILKAGEYKAVCGGMVGATGVLGYTLIREDLVKKTDDVVKTIPPKTPGGKPTPPSDTTTNDVKPDPLQPGGEGTRRVTVHAKVTQVNKELPTPSTSEGDVPALLSIKGDAFVLEYQLPNAEGVNCEGKWEGTVERNGTSISVAGKTYVSVTIQMKPSGTTLDKATGTFTGKLAGNRLSGTAIEEGTTTYSYNPFVRSFRRTHEWYIEDFNK